MKTTPRHERLHAPEREAAAQMLYAMDQTGQTPEEAAAWFLREHPLAAGEDVRARDLVRRALEFKPRIAALVDAHARHWRWERMSLVERAILLVGCAELAAGAAATTQIIGDCALLARRYSQPAAFEFTQGVLRTLAEVLAAAPAGEAADA